MPRSPESKTSGKDASALVWQVVLPDKGRARMGQPRQRAELVAEQEAGEYRITLPLAVGRLMASKLRRGELEVSSLAELRRELGELARLCAHTRVERLIDRRDYARSELEEKLRLDGYATSTVDSVLETACAAGLVSDERYASSFIRSKLAAGWGSRRIEHELGRRGIDITAVPGWPDEFMEDSDDEERALEIARRRMDARPRAFERVVRHLCSKGYALGVATRAARQAQEEVEAE